MTILAVLLVFIGGTLFMAGEFLLLLLAFNENIFWGFFCLLSFLFPVLCLVFVFAKWNNASVRKGFSLIVSGLMINLLGIGLFYGTL